MFDLSAMDIFLYFLYPLILLSISIYISLKKEMNVEGYFFANRNTHWLVLGISLLTSSLFGPYLLGFTLAGAVSGLPLIYGIISGVILLVLGWYLFPSFIEKNIYTLPEYFEKRFNKTCRYIVSSIYIFLNIFIRLLIILIAGSLLMNMITGIDPYFSLLLFLVITGIYLIIGGLRSEIYVSIIQVLFITIVAAGFFIWIAFGNDSFSLAINNSSLSNSNNDLINSGFELTGLIIGLPAIAFWFWCADQFVVQKILSAKNITHLKKASLTAGILQIIPVLIFLLPGIIISTLFSNAAAGEILNTMFSGNFLPDSLKGGLLIGITAALVASFAGFFNSTSTLVTFDFYLSLKPGSSDRKLVLIGRLTILVLLFLSILLVPFSQSMNFGVCVSLLKTFSYFVAMIAAVFLIGLVNKKIKSISAVLTLITASILIMLRSIHEIFFNSHSFGSNLLDWFVHSGFLEFSAFTFMISIFFMFGFNKPEWGCKAAGMMKRIIKPVFLKFKYKGSIHKKVTLLLLIIVITSVGRAYGNI